jgi:hypothetical protein
MALYKGHSVTNVSPQRVKKCVAATCKKEGCDAVERCRRYAELSLSSKTMLEPPRRELAHLCVNVLAGRGRMSVKGVRRDKAAFSSGCKPHPATAPAGSNRSSHWPEFYCMLGPNIGDRPSSRFFPCSSRRRGLLRLVSDAQHATSGDGRDWPRYRPHSLHLGLHQPDRASQSAPKVATQMELITTLTRKIALADAHFQQR